MPALTLEWAVSLLLFEMIIVVVFVVWLRRDRAKRVAQFKRLVDMTEELARRADGLRETGRSQDGNR